MCMRRCAGDAQADLQLVDAVVAGWHEHNAVAVRIFELAGGVDVGRCYREFDVAAGPYVGQRVPDVIDLQDGLTDVVAQLVDAGAQRQQLGELEPDGLLPELEHCLTLIGIEPHIQGLFGKLHNVVRPLKSTV